MGVNVDDFLLTATEHLQIDMFFSDLKNFTVKSLGIVHEFLGMRINHDDEVVTIVEMLKELGLENAHRTRIPINDTTNDVVEDDVMLPICGTHIGFSVRTYQSLVGKWYGYRDAPAPIFCLRYIVRHSVRIVRLKGD